MSDPGEEDDVDEKVVDSVLRKMIELYVEEETTPRRWICVERRKSWGRAPHGYWKKFRFLNKT